MFELEPPSSVLDDYFSLGIFLILTLLVYAIISGTAYAFTHVTEAFPNGERRAKRVSHFISEPILFTGTIMQFSLLFKLLIVFISLRLLNSIWGAALLSIILIYSVNEAVAMMLKGKEESFFMKMSYFSIFFSAIAAPFNRVLIAFTSMPDQEREEREVQSLEEITEESPGDNQKEARERKLLKSIVALSNTSVSDIMKPRIEVVALSTSMSANEVMEVAVNCGYSRLPVYEGNLDNVKGFLYIKDLVGYLQEKKSDYDWKSHVRQAYFVPGNKKIGDLLEEFRQKKIHLALVADEYGGTDGIVTLEDVLEEIVGEISDETDKTQ